MSQHTSLVALFNAGFILRNTLVKQRYFRQDRRTQYAMLGELQGALSAGLGFIESVSMDYEGAGVFKFLTNFAKAYNMFQSEEDINAWAFSVFFAASPVIFTQSLRRGYFPLAHFVLPAFSGCYATPDLKENWFALFERYLWETDNYTLAAGVVHGNVRMSEVFNSIVPAEQAITVYDEDAVVPEQYPTVEEIQEVATTNPEEDLDA